MNPSKVSVDGVVQVVNKTFRTDLVTIPGIGAAVAYVSGDALGLAFTMKVPQSGIIHAAVFIDRDDEGIETDLVLFSKPFTATADNAEFTVSDADFENFIGTITFATWKNFALNQVSTAGAMGLAYVAPDRIIHVQAVTRGAPNIAAGAEPQVRLIILSDE